MFYINYLNKCNIQNNFILRKTCWFHSTIDKVVSRKQYIDNMENNIFIFCYRGEGNFSYRFYETLMMGKIPLFIDTECVLPFEKYIKKPEVGLFLNEKDIISGKVNLEQELMNYIKKYKKHFNEMQKNNRLLWEKIYSPVGFLNTVLNTEKLQ